MVRDPSSELRVVYTAAERFVSAALRADDSLFTPGRPVWAKLGLDDLNERFVESPDGSSDSFLQKFKRQVSGARDETIQLATELIYVHLLITRSISGDKKRELVNTVLSWMSEPVEIPDDLGRALELGIVGTGMAYLTRRPNQLWMLIAFMRRWKALPVDERDEQLKDPWEFKETVLASAQKASASQEEALLHLVFPETFEPITLRSAKKRIVEQFSEHVSTATTDVDRQLLEIREALTQEFGARFLFFDPPIAQLWRKDSSHWGQFLEWAERFYDRDKIDQGERNYKFECAARLREAIQAVRQDQDDWPKKIRQALGGKNNITSHHTDIPFLEWCENETEAARAALLSLLDEERPLQERIRAFSRAFPKEVVSGRGTRVNLISYLLMGFDPTEFPPYKFTPFQKAIGLVGFQQPGPSAGEESVYEWALQFLDEFIDKAAERGLELRDRLDAQSLVWVLTSMYRLDELEASERRAFLEFMGEEPEDDKGDVTIREPDEDYDSDGETLSDVAVELFMDVEQLEDMIRLLESKRQIIFHGPPGTGKTFVALRLAEHIANSRDAVELVQFHPSYAYEDFVEGYRPHPFETGPGFRLQDGPLKRIAKRAAAAPDSPHVLVIDELNRGNIAKVFGELYFLLEYRKRELQLQYSQDLFALPSNLLVIGTMNTADRSIALVDLALRRRFHFYPFYPDRPPIQGLLGRWLAKHKPKMGWVAPLLDRLNRLLDDRDVAVGPSHFMRKDLDHEWVRLIWEYSILPYVAEQLHGEPGRLDDFTLEALLESGTDDSVNDENAIAERGKGHGGADAETD